jgi:prolipoprotein diacylglyceryl transferase
VKQLAAIPSPTTAAWPLGPLTLRAYALCIIIGILVACWITERRMRNRGATPYLVLDVAIWAVPAGIIGARIYSLITSPGLYFGKGLSAWEPLEIWHGGLGIWGAVAGGALGAWIACRNRGIPLTFVLDAAAPALPVAQAIGRWGNWFNNELYGRQTSLPWGLEIHQMDPSNPGHALVMEGQPVLLGTYQPTFLYESVWDIGVAVLVWLLDRKYRFGKGRAFALYVMAYTVGRFWVELLRSDDANHFGGMRINNWVAILVFAGAMYYFLRVKGPQERLEVTESGKLRAVVPDSAEAVEAQLEEPATTSTGSASTPDDDDDDDGGGDAESGTAVLDSEDDEHDDTGDKPEETTGSQPKLRSSAET